MDNYRKKKPVTKNYSRTGNNKSNKKDFKKNQGQSSNNNENTIDATFRMGIEKIVDDFMQSKYS